MLSVLRLWGPVCAYAVLIFYMSSQSHPEESLPSFVFNLSDKVLHAAEYALLGALCYRALRGSSNDVWRQQAIPVAILLASVYGISDEVHQSFVPFRDSSWLDWVADTIGSMLGAFVMHRVGHFRATNSIPAA
ncbi:MAG: VanZ family protein [Nitrospira sp.]|nr:VanZ family protein [Nitrospira sp.]MDH4369225.1 VanZ family protein [Nitrospira sp.]MDH5346346.1 VanZ family protein [Nitrospira sp.]MDH5496675.1 VanZ family protein [Nitrospira sp.]MDH5726769.1 VanZ family protein [Nitrospira sp.]